MEQNGRLPPLLLNSKKCRNQQQRRQRYLEINIDERQTISAVQIKILQKSQLLGHQCQHARISQQYHKPEGQRHAREVGGHIEHHGKKVPELLPRVVVGFRRDKRHTDAHQGGNQADADAVHNRSLIEGCREYFPVIA